VSGRRSGPRDPSPSASERRPPSAAALDEVGLLTDLYELTMLQGYWRQGMLAPAVFSLFVRRLPERRNVLIASGVDEALEWLERARFGAAALGYLESLGLFEAGFLDWLAAFRFTGEVWAVRDGTAFFAGEPILEVEAPLPEAQWAETLLMNLVHHETVLASTAARVCAAAAGRPVVDFGFRRMHGLEGAVRGARALYVGGVAATSNVAAGRRYGIPVAGTMAHSYIQAHSDEAAAFRSFTELYPGTVLLVDTYDTLAGVQAVIALARASGQGLPVRGIRLDSG